MTIDPTSLLDALPDMALVLDRSARVVYANAMCRLLLMWGDDRLGDDALSFVHPDDIASVASSLTTINGKTVGSPIEFRVRDAAGGWHWVELIGSDRCDDPHVGGYVCVARDITQRRMWEVAGGDSARLQLVLQHSSSIAMLLDGDGRIDSANNALNRILGFDKSVLIGRTLVRFADADSSDRLADAIERCVSDGLPVAVEVHMRRADPVQPPCPIRFEFRNLLADPVLRGILVSGHDVTELFETRQVLEQMAHFDALTGLANRSSLIRTIEQWLADGVGVAAFLIDLDRFKPVNDVHGHRVGDRLLEMVAARLASAIRPFDLLGRLGGDEFVVVARDIATFEGACALADRLRRVFDDRFTIGDESLSIGGTVGFALSTGVSTAASLLDEADSRMYASKRRSNHNAPQMSGSIGAAPHQPRKVKNDSCVA